MAVVAVRRVSTSCRVGSSAAHVTQVRHYQPHVTQVRHYQPHAALPEAAYRMALGVGSGPRAGLGARDAAVVALPVPLVDLQTIGTRGAAHGAVGRVLPSRCVEAAAQLVPANLWARHRLESDSSSKYFQQCSWCSHCNVKGTTSQSKCSHCSASSGGHGGGWQQRCPLPTHSLYAFTSTRPAMCTGCGSSHPGTSKGTSSSRAKATHRLAAAGGGHGGRHGGRASAVALPVPLVDALAGGTRRAAQAAVCCVLAACRVLASALLAPANLRAEEHGDGELGKLELQHKCSFAVWK
jgi:hypothetical protein